MIIDYIIKGSKSSFKGPINNRIKKKFKRTMLIKFLKYIYFSLHGNLILLEAAIVAPHGNLW